jgi:hypothetical protein
MSDKEQATMKRPILTLALAGTLALSALPAQAGHHHHAGDALAAGLIGLGIGLAVTAPRTYYYDAPPVYAPSEVVIEREYVVPRRIYYYDDRPYYRHHHHRRHHRRHHHRH